MLDFVTLAPKPVLEIQAVEFSGGETQGNEIVDWIEEFGGSAEWHEDDPGSHLRCGLKEHIRINIGASAYTYVYIGDFVIHNEEGLFKPLHKRTADAKYDRVNRLVSVLPIKTESEYEQSLAA